MNITLVCTSIHIVRFGINLLFGSNTNAVGEEPAGEKQQQG